jgi:hypothetical protein
MSSTDAAALRQQRTDSPPSSTDPLVRELEKFDKAVAAAQDGLLTHIEHDLISLLAAAARAAAAEHAAILSSELGASPGVSSMVVNHERARAYRREVSARVMEPLRATLARLDIGQTLARWQEDAGRSIAAAAAAAPGEVAREEPTDTYGTVEGDSVPRRIRKASVRTRRRVTGAGRSVLRAARILGRSGDTPLHRRTQRVPVALLFEYHAAMRLASSTDIALDALRTRVAEPIDELERAVTVWLHSLIALEASFDPSGIAAPADGTAARDADETAAASAADDPDSGQASATIGEAATALTLGLESLAACNPLADFAIDLRERSAAARQQLLTDVAQAGTFMLDEDARRKARVPVRAARAAAEREAQWIRWYRQSVARIELNVQLESFQRAVPVATTALVHEVGVNVIEPVQQLLQRSRDAIAALRVEVKEACDQAGARGDADALKNGIAAAFDSVREQLASTLRDQLDDRSFDRRTRAAAEECIGEITALLGALPATLEVHEPAAADAPAFPDARPLRIRLRRIAEQAFDAVLLERLHMAPHPVTAALDRIRTEVRQLEKVVRFSLDSSLAELASDDGAKARLAGAEELALNGIDRTVHTLTELRTSWQGELPALALRLRGTIDTGWAQLYDRVRVEDSGQEQLLDFRYRVRSAFRESATLAGARGRRAFRYGTRLARIGRGRAQELIRLGQSAVEGSVITDDERRRTLEALYTMDDSIAALPLVYRRLFSFHPVKDPALLEGRAADLEAIARHFAEWRVGITDAFVVTGFDGNGRTSFLNVVQETILQDADVRRISFVERIVDESELVQQLARLLGCDEDVADLDGLADRVSAAPRPPVPVACIMENVEHLLLRTSQGNGLVRALLTFMSRLDSHVFWFATMSESAWKYIAAVEDGAARLVRRQALTPITRADLEAVITKRHLRSGLGLIFDAPQSPTPIMKRRLGKARDEAERQAVLRTDFFDRLQRQSGQNLLLAMFYWIRSVSLDTAQSTIHVAPLTPLSFGYIESLPLEYSFALKAFLDHATLTTAEYDRIFQGAGGDSRHVFETLGNLLVIEPADGSDRPAQFAFTTVQDGTRYRIRPLLVHPVLVTLRARNIVT